MRNAGVVRGTRASKIVVGDPPEKLGEIFYNLDLDAGQTALRDAIWDKNNLITFVNAGAGCGKTLIAVATACLLIEYGLFDEIIYITSACHEHRQGFLRGSLSEKSEQYFYPLHDALMTIGINPQFAIHSDDVNIEKTGKPFITVSTDTFIRGRNFGNGGRAIVICDELQNSTLDQIATMLSRICKGSIAICIGHSNQCDLINKNKSGFARCIDHFRDRPWATVCELTKNYRGEISQWADLLPRE